ncbi:hypothetical protein AV641_12065 [Pseudomonas fragi]|nr:hypothetical protein AV641_12065 [Pseudomonas fragi]
MTEVSRSAAVRHWVGASMSIALTLGLVSKTCASGGSYVVDDGAINSPGECNIDAWFTSNRHHSATHNAVISQGCTSHNLPWLQWGGAVEQGHSDDGTARQLSPQLKAQLYSSLDQSLELALSGEARFALNRAHSYDGTDLNLPLTWQPFAPLRLNLNGGWSHAWNDGKQSHRLTWGSGFEYAVTNSLTLIGERYGEEGGEQSWQTGPRFHIGSAVDLDLVLGRTLNRDRDRWLTTGATLRF